MFFSAIPKSGSLLPEARLSAIFIPVFGFYAAGYTTVASYIVYSTGHYWFSRKVCMEEIGSFELFDSKSILLISIGVFGCSIAFIFLYQFGMIRYLMAILLLIVAIGQYKRIISVIKSIRKR